MLEVTVRKTGLLDLQDDRRGWDPAVPVFTEDQMKKHGLGYDQK